MGEKKLTVTQGGTRTRDLDVGWLLLVKLQITADNAF